MKSITSGAVSAVFLLAATPSEIHAQTGSQDSQTPFANPCDSAPFTDFDFWVGDWVAFDYDTGVVQGIDRIEKINNGCVILQKWSQMTDRYRAPGADFKYGGISMNTVIGTSDGPRWQQNWVSNYGGMVTLTGGLDAEGRMVIETAEFPVQNNQIAKRIWYWEPEEDGTIHSWGEIYLRDPDGEFGEPQIPWNLRYVSRHNAPDLIASSD